MDTTVVIPAFNRFDLLKPVLEGFAQQSLGDGFRVVVVDDGSASPVAELLTHLSLASRFSCIRHDRNRGRGAALNTGIRSVPGGTVIVCDSDVVPYHRMVEDHIAFHRQHPSAEATCLGALQWGVTPNSLGKMLGARSNARLKRTGSFNVDWAEWYTDNWSFKHSLLADQELFFDEEYRAWGYEDLDLGFRLAKQGVTNTLIEGACGHHLKLPTVAQMQTNFCRGAANLVRLVTKFGQDGSLDWWLKLRLYDEWRFAALEEVLGLVLQALELVYANEQEAPHEYRRLEILVGDAIFLLGNAEGLCAHTGLPPLTQKHDRQFYEAWMEMMTLACGELTRHNAHTEARELRRRCTKLLGKRWRRPLWRRLITKMSF